MTDNNLIIDLIKLNNEYPYIVFYGKPDIELSDSIQEYFTLNNIPKNEQEQILVDIFNNIFTEFNTQNIQTNAQIAVYDSTDKLEIAVKNNIHINDIYPKGYTELYKKIGGIQMLNMRNRKGETITSLEGGKQKMKAQSIIKQYIAIENRPEIKQYAIEITDIYDIPFLLDDSKVSNGYYINRLMPLIISLLLSAEHKQHTSIPQIAKDIGLVNKLYRTKDHEKLKKYNPRFTVKMTNRFYSNTNPVLERIIFRILDILQDDYSAIDYEKNFQITKRIEVSCSEYEEHYEKYGNFKTLSDRNENGNYYIYETSTSTKEERKLIREMQSKVLKELKLNNMWNIFRKNKQQQFYSRVIERINEELDTRSEIWTNYKNQIEITPVDTDKLKSLLKENPVDEIKLIEAKNRLIRRLQKSALTEHNNSIKKESNDPEIIKNQIINYLVNNGADPLLKDLLEIDVYSIEDMKKYGIYKPFHDWEQNYETQIALIACLIGEYDYSVEPDDLLADLPF